MLKKSSVVFFNIRVDFLKHIDRMLSQFSVLVGQVLMDCLEHVLQIDVLDHTWGLHHLSHHGHTETSKLLILISEHPQQLWDDYWRLVSLHTNHEDLLNQVFENWFLQRYLLKQHTVDLKGSLLDIWSELHEVVNALESFLLGD